MPKTDISVRELVDKAQREELVLPETQRRYVWTATRVRDLLDSLYRGYPSGTILVWETDEDIETRQMAVRATKSPSTSQKLLLLDGQQRVTSLTAILTGEPVHVRNRKKPIEILFNLEHPDGPPSEITEVEENDDNADDVAEEEKETPQRDVQRELRKRAFIVGESKALKNDPVWVSVTDIFKKSESQILREVGISSDDPRWDKYSERLQKVKRISDYQYVMQVLEKNMSYEEVTEIFVRVNSLGIKLRSTDLALAQITSKWKGFMDLIDELAEEFGDDKDYIIETGLPVRLLTVFATHQSKFKTIGKAKKDKLEKNWELAVQGLRFAVNFIRSNVDVENLQFISSPFLLVPIAVYAVLNDEKLSQKEERALLKWFYNAHMWGFYSGSAESKLDADISVLFKNKGVDELVKQLELKLKKLDVSPEELAFKGIKSPFFSMLYFVLKNNGAKDWWSGLKLSDKHLGASHSIQYHHIFPKSLLQREGVDSKAINELSNMAFIGGKPNRAISNKKPKDYLEKEVIAKRGEESLKSQLIPLNKEMWELDRYPDFLDYRRKAVANEINKFMRKFD